MSEEKEVGEDLPQLGGTTHLQVHCYLEPMNRGSKTEEAKEKAREGTVVYCVSKLSCC